jgi:hypothetical protein
VAWPGVADNASCRPTWRARGAASAIAGSYDRFQILCTIVLTREYGRAEFRLMMQIAMLAGFASNYPVSSWLVRKGIKEKM